MLFLKIKKSILINLSYINYETSLNWLESKLVEFENKLVCFVELLCWNYVFNNFMEGFSLDEISSIIWTKFMLLTVILIIQGDFHEYSKYQ